MATYSTCFIPLCVLCLYPNAAAGAARDILDTLGDFALVGRTTGENLCAQADALIPSKNSKLWEQLAFTFGTDAFRGTAIEWLGGAVRVPTESYHGMRPIGGDPRWEMFGLFHDYLLEAFLLALNPRAHESGEGAAAGHKREPRDARRSLLGMFAAEWLHTSYPHLPTRVLKAAVSGYVRPMSCASVAMEMGAAPLLRWNRTPATLTRDSMLHSGALSSVPRALTALVHTHGFILTARKFAHGFFFNREVDLRSMLKFTDPQKAFQDTILTFGRERPISRMLKETGRYSNTQMFVVGIFSGADQLGEGFGSSLKMAEFQEYCSCVSLRGVSYLRVLIELGRDFETELSDGRIKVTSHAPCALICAWY